jgi:hypothetical protein
MGLLVAVGKGKLAAATVLCVGAGLVVAAISLGQGGPPAQQSAYALDSSGTGPPSLPVAKVTGPHKTKNMQPVFVLGPSDPGSTFVCRMGLRPWAPCTSPVRVPDLGFKRHVLVVQVIDAAGRYSLPLKHPFYVVKPHSG